MTGKDLYRAGPKAGVRAPILITHFEGALDAGSAGTLAVVQLLRSLSPQRVVTFDSDELIDYRSHRPIMTVENWVTKDVVPPEIALDLLHDDSGMPILLLHGPEPDSKWESFAEAVTDLARQAGVETVVSFSGIPAAVPHTRPVAVHIQSTDSDLVPPQPQMGGVMQFPSPLSTFLQYRMSEQDLPGVSLIAAVPYYMADSTYPRGGSALLRKLAEMADLSLPIGDLERGADADASQVNELVGQNPDVQRTVSALERHYDALIEARDEDDEDAGRGMFVGSEEELMESLRGMELPESLSNPFDGADFDIDLDGEESVADAIGDAIERYLRHQQGTEEASDSQTDSDSDGPDADEAEFGGWPNS